MAGFFQGCTDEQLRAVELFADLDDAVLADLRKHSHFIGAHPGLHLVRQGDFGFQLYVILAGDAEVRRDDEVIAHLGQGDIFGEMALLNDSHRSADVVATSVMSLMTMTASGFRHLSSSHPEIERRVRQLAERRLNS